MLDINDPPVESPGAALMIMKALPLRQRGTAAWVQAA
jgi:hypothetical protein